MSIEDYYFKNLCKLLEEIRDEMRNLNTKFEEFMAIPQPIILNGAQLPSKEELEWEFNHNES